MSFFASLLRIILRKPSSFFEEEPFKSIDLLLLQANYQKAKELLDKYEESISKMDEKTSKRAKVLTSVYRSKMEIEQGNTSDCIDSLKENLELIDQINVPLIEIYTYITLAAAYEGSGDLNAATETVQTGLSKLSNVKVLYPKAHDIVQAMLFNLDGKIKRKKGQIPDAVDLLKQSIDIFTKYEMRLYTADPLNTLGICYVIMGDADNSLATFDECREIYEELSNSGQLLKIYNNRAMINRGIGKLDEALEDFNRAYELSTDLDIKNYSAAILMNIGMVSQDKGQLDASRKNFEQSLDLFTELGNKPNMAKCYVNLGVLYSIFGDMAKSTEFYESALNIYEELEMEDDAAIVFKNMAQNYAFLEDYEKSLEHWEKSFDIFQRTGNLMEQVATLVGLVDINLLNKNKEKAQEYLNIMEQFSEEHKDNKLMEVQYKLSKANVLIQSDRVVQRADAQKLYSEIADGEVIQHQTTTEAMLSLGELLLAELKASPSEEALDEFKDLIDRLENVVRGEGSIVAVPTLVQVLVLKSKLALIDLEVDEGQQLMEEAYELAKNNRLAQFASVIDEERKQYNDEILKYKKMVDTNASLLERLEQTNIENYLQRAESILKR